MVNDRRREAALISTMRTTRHIRYTAEQSLLGLWILGYIEELFDVCWDGLVKNPWPNVDAINGALQYHFGVTQFDFYTVMFGVSRILGLTAHIVWARALGKPIERPKSLTTPMLEELTAKAQPVPIVRIPVLD